MISSFPSLLAETSGTLERNWTIIPEGLAPGWAFLIFAVLTVATVIAYRRFAPNVTRGRRIGMVALRVLACALLASLLTKPVLRLTEDQLVKQQLAVLVDASRSMDRPDRRDTAADITRAAIASGLADPSTNVGSTLPEAVAGQVGGLTRMELVNKLAENRKLNLWPRLAEHSDLMFYRFGSSIQSLGPPKTLGSDDKSPPLIVPPAIIPDASATAIGDALRDVIQGTPGQSLGGVLLVTDGGHNQGSSPLEAARIAREQDVPLFIYGVGVTAPPDLKIVEVTTRTLAFVDERLEVRAKVSSTGLPEEPTTLTLSADGVPVTAVETTLGGDSEDEFVFHYIPQNPGDVRLEVSVPVREEEISHDNNSATTAVRVTAEKFKVLLIEQEPRWDFRYLLDFLQRDESLEVRCVMIDGEPGLERLPDSPFLPALPTSRSDFFEFQVIILGDVNPRDLGIGRMEIIGDWVQAGGGLILLAGSNFNPASYQGTPLEALLPVAPDTSRPPHWSALREPEPFPLALTAAGRRSPYLRMDADPAENSRIWESFPGVRWVAPVARIKPGAEVLLVDPRPSSAGRYGMLPVFAMQNYGSGKCVYFGTDETYRWRSRTGEKYYSVLWGQIMQTLALQLLDSASPLTQLRTDRRQYDVGESVVISGTAYTGNYAPLIAPSLEGTVTLLDEGGAAAGEAIPLHLAATGNNTFRGSFTATQPGRYRFSTAHDPESILHFDVVQNDPENSRLGLDDRLLVQMASIAGGRFCREEDLHQLPGWISDRSTRIATYRNVDLYSSTWILALFISLLCGEWLLRRLTRLK